MSEIKPVPEANLPSGAVKGGLPSKFFFDPSFSPASPKMRELQARHEAAHATGDKHARSPVFG